LQTVYGSKIRYWASTETVSGNCKVKEPLSNFGMENK